MQSICMSELFTELNVVNNSRQPRLRSATKRKHSATFANEKLCNAEINFKNDLTQKSTCKINSLELKKKKLKLRNKKNKQQKIFFLRYFSFNIGLVYNKFILI